MSKTNRIHHIWQYGKKYWGLFTVAEVCIIGLYTIAVLLPLNMTFLTDEVLTQGKHELLGRAIWNYVILFAFSCVLNLIYAYVWQTLSNRYVGDVKISVFNHAVQAKAAWLSSVSCGDIMSRIDTDCDQFLNAIQRNLFHSVNSVIMCIGIVVIVWFIHPIVAVLLVAAAVFPIVLTRVLGIFVQRAAKKEAGLNGTYQGRLYEILKSMKDVRLMSADKWACQQMNSFMETLIRLRNKLKWLDFSVDKIVSFVNLLASLAVYLYCAVLVHQGEMTIGTFLAVLQYIALLHRKMNWILRLYLEWFGRKAGLDRVIEILELPAEQEADKKETISTSIDSIGLSRVRMTYDRNEILHDVSFTIRKGERVAIVGRSGSGKTTIADLIVGLYDTTSGNVEINGTDIRSYDIHSVRQHIAVLSQQVMLFKTTIRENLLIGSSSEADLSDETLWNMCDALAIGDAIRRSPNGLDAIPGENGFDLSGGQKQRLMIARVLLKQPDVLILDEATSALDVDTEQLVLDLLLESNKQSTLIVISHRKETVSRCDRSIVIWDGTLAADGTHDNLLKESDVYRGMFGDDETETVTTSDI